MDPFALHQPSTELEKSAEDMLDDLERLVDAAELKGEISSPEVRQRFDKELAPKVDDVRRLVAQQSPRAKNALEDLIILFREYLLTSGARVVPATDDGELP
jgi:hypothetical protein